MWPFDSRRLAEREAREVLQKAGFTGSARGMRIIAYSPSDPAANARLHTRTNRTLLDTLMAGNLGDCIHITGKMNALVDPFHRRLCAEMARSGKDRFAVVYDAPSLEGDLEAMALQSAARWKGAAWNDKLAAVRLIGDDFVDVRAASTKNEVQYTVFGGRFTQLQGIHSDAGNAPSPGKQIWLIESETVTGFLTEKAKRTLSRSQDVPEGAFRSLFARMNGVAAHELIGALARGGPTGREALLSRRLLDFDPGAGDILDGLKTLGLVALDAAGLYGSTHQGLEYISRK